MARTWSLPWTVRLYVSIISTIVDNVCRPNGTVNRCLIHFLDYQTSPNSNPNSVSSADISVDATHNLWFRLYSPSFPNSNDQLFPILVFLSWRWFQLPEPRLPSLRHALS
ncbi:hypothetical protein PTKIN_Ptkin08bG0089600 [Pterospermum kingtungense]